MEIILQILPYTGLSIPLLLIIILHKYIKCENKEIPIITNYTPRKELYPLLVAYILEKKITKKDIVAQIIQMHKDGIIEISEDNEKNLWIKGLKKEIENPAIKRLYQEILAPDNQNLNFLPKGRKDIKQIKKIIKSFKNQNFAPNISNELEQKKITSVKFSGYVETELKKDLYRNKYLDTRKHTIINNFTGVSILLTMFIYLIWMLNMHETQDFLDKLNPIIITSLNMIIIGIVLSTPALLLFGKYTDPKTKLGNEIYYELKGLEKYINTAEKKRISFETEDLNFDNLFNPLLSYAIVFGLKNKWTKKFNKITFIQDEHGYSDLEFKMWMSKNQNNI